MTNLPLNYRKDRIDAQTELNEIAANNRSYGEIIPFVFLILAIILVPYALGHYAQSRIKHQDGVTVRMQSIPQPEVLK